MKRILLFLTVAATMFGAAAGASWTWKKKQAEALAAAAAEESPDDSEETHDVEPTGSASRSAAAAPDRSPRGGSPAGDASEVEETVKLASGLRDRAALIRERENQLLARQRQLELVIDSIRGERAAIDDLRAELDEALQTAEDHHAEIRKQHTELDIKQQNIEGRLTEMAGSEKDNLKKMASMYDNMAAESAAKILQQMADSGSMDTAVKLLAVMKERQAAKVLAEMTDPSLAAQLSERLKDLKHPPSTKNKASP